MEYNLYVSTVVTSYSFGNTVKTNDSRRIKEEVLIFKN